MKKYNQTTPPDYDLSLLDFPIAIFGGKNDVLATRLLELGQRRLQHFGDIRNRLFEWLDVFLFQDSVYMTGYVMLYLIVLKIDLLDLLFIHELPEPFVPAHIKQLLLILVPNFALPQALNIVI